VKWRIAVAGAAATIAFGGVVAAVDTQSTLTLAGPNDTLSAQTVLASITVAPENPRGYKRSLFKHWIDVDGDGCDAREQVLKRDAIGLPQVDPFKCFVVEADWLSPYDGVKTTDRTEVDIDHVVALKEAWDSGAFAWNEAQRTAYANDTSDSRTLLAVSSSSNRSKGDKDPSNWLPALRAYQCTYVANWIAVKARWGLSMDQSEWGRLNNMLSGSCAGTTLRGWNPPPAGVGTPASTTSSLATVTTLNTSSTTSTATSSTTSTTSTSTTSSTSTSTSTSTSGAADSTVKVNPGSFCAPEGAVGVYNSRNYVCSKTNASGVPYSGGRARWRQQT
jgi:cytochrome c5